MEREKNLCKKCRAEIVKSEKYCGFCHEQFAQVKTDKEETVLKVLRYFKYTVVLTLSGLWIWILTLIISSGDSMREMYAKVFFLVVLFMVIALLLAIKPKIEPPTSEIDDIGENL